MLKRGGIGSASIALIFVVLCMTIFTVISFVFAISEESLIQNEVDSVKAFYAADTLAEQVLAEILSAEGAVPVSAMGIDIFSRWDIGLMAEIVYFTIPVMDNSELYVAIELDGFNYNIISWRMYPMGLWEADDNINIFQGFGDEDILPLEENP